MSFRAQENYVNLIINSLDEKIKSLKNANEELNIKELYYIQNLDKILSQLKILDNQLQNQIIENSSKYNSSPDKIFIISFLETLIQSQEVKTIKSREIVSKIQQIIDILRE